MHTTFAAGFAKRSLQPAITIRKRYVDEVAARALALKGGRTAAVIVTTDLVSIRGHLAGEARARIARALALPVEAVAIFSTHNHGARTPEMEMEKFYDICVAAARSAFDRLAPAEVARVTARPHSPLCIGRRLRVADVGAFTFWYGQRDLGQGRADGSHLLKTALNRLAAGQLKPYRALDLAEEPRPGDFLAAEAPLPVAVPTLFPPAADDLLQALFFRTPGGAPIGALLRYPAHAMTANRDDVDWRSGDYPTYACAGVERIFGGDALFIPGPSGDQCPIVERKRLQLARELGSAVGNLALEGLASARWERSGPFAVSAPEVRLRARQEYLLGSEAIAAERTAIEDEMARLAGQDGRLARLKSLAERHEMLGRVGEGTPAVWGRLTAAQAVDEGFSFPGFVLRIGSTTLAGWPGEPFAEYTLRLKRETGMGDELITLEVANGHISYFPTRAEYALGGYEAAHCTYSDESEERLMAALKQGLTDIGQSIAK